MLKRYNQSDKFVEVYNSLNEKQRFAVDTIEGPVMVIAGPGTGKTQILSARIGKILMETDASPENILCLTYTDAGVVAMRKRILSFIGPDAYKVNLYTFHAFCNDVIQENLSLFDKTSMDPISELEKIELLKQLIDNFPKNHPLKRYRGDVYFEMNNLQSLFSTMKKEGWSAAFINEKIDEYLNDLPNREDYIYKRANKQFKKGDLKIKDLEEQKERMEKLRAAVGEFENFQRLMQSKNRYDFEDMINWVIKAFEEIPNLLAKYQEQFLYILVDEYQDTSGTQNKLVQLLINYWDVPNVFVVGDDDQSIYRFQGANVENMLSFAESYKRDLQTVVLVNNYRSIQPILDVSKTLIDTNEERLIKQINGLSKDLVSSHDLLKHIRKEDCCPIVNEYQTPCEEMIDVTLQVEALIKKGVLPGAISIIYKEHKYGEELAHYFKLKSLPVFSKKHINILELPLIKKIVAILNYLASEHDITYSGDQLLFQILHFDFYKIPAIDIAKLSIEASEKKYGGEKTSLRKVLFDKANTPPKTLFDRGAPEGMKLASRVMEKLISDVPNVTLQTLVESIIKEAGVLKYVMAHEEKIWLMQVLTAFFNFVKEETRRRPLLNVHNLVDTIDLMQREKLPIPIVQVSGNDKGINLLTAHGSKGLEYEHVFVVGSNATTWEKKKKPSTSYSFPDTMFTSQPKQKDDEELRRLFYVALTRAAQHLHISYSKYKNDGKDLEPSMFIAEIQQEHLLPINRPAISAETQAEFASLQFAGDLKPEIEKFEEDFISRILDKFVMNVTALNNYLDCPLNFYFNNLIRVPSGKSEATEFGSAVHHALQLLFEKMQKQNNTFPTKQDFVGDFKWYMQRHRESFTQEQYQRRMEYGFDVLSNYYDKYIHNWNHVVAVERNIRNVVVKGVPLKGKLDKLEFDGKFVNVVDYKSGDPDKSKTKLEAPNAKEPNGGSYWRQAVFYKILIDHYDPKDWKVVSTEFDFIEPDKKKEYIKAKLVITPEDITTVTQQIVQVWEHIQQRDFYTGCGSETCHWCKFVKSNDLAVALHEQEEEDLFVMDPMDFNAVI